MRASKLITISTIAVLMGATSLAIGQGAGSRQSGESTQAAPNIGHGSARGAEPKAYNPQAAEAPTRRGEAIGERGASAQGQRNLELGQQRSLERGRAMAAERSRAPASERGQAFTTERAQATPGKARAAEQIEGQPRPQMRPSYGQAGTPGQAQARASSRELGATAEQRLTPEQRQRVQEILAARRDIPQATNLLPGDIRVNGLVPRNVRLVAIPAEVGRIFPRLRRDRVFMRGDRVVIVDPTTSRIVAVL